MNKKLCFQYFDNFKYCIEVFETEFIPCTISKYLSYKKLNRKFKHSFFYVYSVSSPNKSFENQDGSKWQAPTDWNRKKVLITAL